MVTLLSSLAFAVFVIAQVAAVIAVRADRQGRPTEALDPRFNHLARLIRSSAG
jgi:hypothetical protein